MLIKIFGQNKEIKQNETGTQNVDICFFLVFDHLVFEVNLISIARDLALDIMLHFTCEI